jgi:Cu2+-exporting ATPase
VLTFAAAAEHKQSHPIARAIVQEATHQQLTIPPINDAAYEVGYGLKVQINDTQVRVGSRRFMQHEAIAIPPAIQAVQQECHDAGQSLVYVAVDSHLAGAIELHPTIRPEARRIIRGLQQRGLEVVIISGDHAQPTLKLAQELGIVRFFAEVLPEEKASLIDRLQAEGRTVCFVGDGINDSIALKKAQVSVSLRGATTIAIDTAQIILTDKSLRQLVTVFELADQLDVTMQRNLLFATLPGSVNVFGVYLLGTGLLNAACLSWLGLTMGMTNTMLPMIQHWQHRSLVTNSRDHHKPGPSPFGCGKTSV